MNMRMRSKSGLLVLLLFLVAALASHLAIAQNQSQAESASYKNVEETVSRLLLVPVYTSSDEKLLNEAGDAAARAITRVVSEQEMNSPETGRRIVLILHLAFEAPQSIVGRNNKTATAALRLLDQLEHTDYGHQPNVIGNARFEIKHSSSTGRPLELVTRPGEPVIDWGHAQWVDSVLAWIDTIKPGMTRSDLLNVFTTEGGLSTRTHRTYVLKQCRIIKVDVEFSISASESEDKIRQISKPYLEYGITD
ncbi:MAG TPA: hypothetical protein VHM93_27110 [Candidatus Acidoferrum sp.]|jgi:hypothetical protein|nr:hypothetical protein [Candidatus Acidoferrum sp.]